MKKYILFILTCQIISFAYSIDISNPRTKFEEVDSSPSARYPLLKFPNGTLEDHTTYFVFVGSNIAGISASVNFSSVASREFVASATSSIISVSSTSLRISTDGYSVSITSNINFVAGANITLSGVATSTDVTLTITGSAGGGGGGDNLGSHIATQTVDFGGFGIANSTSIKSTIELSVSTNFVVNPNGTVGIGTGTVNYNNGVVLMSRFDGLKQSTVMVVMSGTNTVIFVRTDTSTFNTDLNMGYGRFNPALGAKSGYVIRPSTNSTGSASTSGGLQWGGGTTVNGNSSNWELYVAGTAIMTTSSSRWDFQVPTSFAIQSVLTTPSIQNGSDLDSGINFTTLGGIRSTTMVTDSVATANFALSSTTISNTLLVTTRAASTSGTEPLIVVSSGATNGIQASQRVFEVDESSIVASSTFNVTGGGLHINSAPIFYTTATIVDTRMTFMRLFTSTVAANETLTVNASNIAGCSSIVAPMSLTIYGSPALAAGGLEIGAYDFQNTSIPIINRDLTDAKAFMLWVLCK